MTFEWLSNVPQKLPEPLESLVSLVKQVSLEKKRVDYKGSERRSKARTSVVLTARVQPLNESQNPGGDGFLLSSAILHAGLGIVHARSVESPLVGVIVMSQTGNDVNRSSAGKQLAPLFSATNQCATRRPVPGRSPIRHRGSSIDQRVPCGLVSDRANQDGGR